MIRVAESDEELERFAAIRRAASPRETVGPPRRGPDRLLLLYDDAGCGLAAPSNLADSVTVAVFVRPAARRNGVGGALAERLLEHARTAAGRDHLFATVDSLCADGVAFAERRGLVEVDREVELRRSIGAEPPPPPPAGLELASVAERPELLEAAYRAVGAEGYADMPTASPLAIPLEEWLAEEATLPDGSFVALEAGEVVGYAGMVALPADPGCAEHGLTAVRRSHRRRGIAEALKRRQLAWAAESGLRELVTWTQGRNSPMQRLNEKLGYRAAPPWLNLRGPVP